MGYQLGTKLKIINAGLGAMGCNGCEGVVTDEKARSGWVQPKTDSGCVVFNVKLTTSNYDNPKYGIGQVWGVREDGKYEVLDKTSVLSDDVKLIVVAKNGLCRGLDFHEIVFKSKLINNYSSTLKDWDNTLDNLNLIMGSQYGVKFEIYKEDKTIVLTDKKEENMRFKRKDLRMFDVVEWRNGWLMLVIVHGGKFYFSGLTVAEHSSFEWYDDSLKNKVSREYEPVKVYRPNDESSLKNLIADKDIGGYDLLWEEKQELELTLDEIAEKFGVKAENLKIKK